MSCSKYTGFAYSASNALAFGQAPTTSPTVHAMADAALVNCIEGLKLPFFNFNSPKGTPLEYGDEVHLNLGLSLMLSQDQIPKSTFKSPKSPMKNQRPMVVHLAKHDRLSLRRQDQPKPTIKYGAEWCSDEIKNRLMAVRSVFQQRCIEQPDMVEAIQFHMLHLLSSATQNDYSKAQQIQKYCLGANAWGVVQDGQLCWRVADSSTLEVASQKMVAEEDSAPGALIAEAVAAQGALGATAAAETKAAAEPQALWETYLKESHVGGKKRWADEEDEAAAAAIELAAASAIAAADAEAAEQAAKAGCSSGSK